MKVDVVVVSFCLGALIGILFTLLVIIGVDRLVPIMWRMLGAIPHAYS